MLKFFDQVFCRFGCNSFDEGKHRHSHMCDPFRISPSQEGLSVRQQCHPELQRNKLMRRVELAAFDMARGIHRNPNVPDLESHVPAMLPSMNIAGKL